MGQQRIDRLAIAIDDIEDARGQTGLSASN